jgi:hypothetical protein
MKTLVISIAIAVAACGGMQQHTDDLMEAVRGYNEGVRWERYTMAASHVPGKERDQFIEDREDLEKELHISDYEVVRVGAARGNAATIEVKYTWFKDSEGVVRETRALQSWERHGKLWMIVDERRVKGPEMPGLREPDPTPDAPVAAESAANP